VRWKQSDRERESDNQNWGEREINKRRMERKKAGTRKASHSAGKEGQEKSNALR
jgi:hypothetical protein